MPEQNPTNENCVALPKTVRPIIPGARFEKKKDIKVGVKKGKPVSENAMLGKKTRKNRNTKLLR